MNLETRYYFYDLFFSMFVREPEDNIISAWSTGLSIVRSALPDSEIGRAADNMIQYLDKKNATEAIRDEFVRLFWSPVGNRTPLTASYYMHGKLFGEYLVRFREFLKKSPYKRKLDYCEPEDTLPFHLDLMRSFIKEEMNSVCPLEKSKWHALQKELVIDFLMEWVEYALNAVAQHEAAIFYIQAALMARSFFELEKDCLLGDYRES